MLISILCVHYINMDVLSVCHAKLGGIEVQNTITLRWGILVSVDKLG